MHVLTMPADNMFPGLALPGQKPDQVLITPSSTDKLLLPVANITTTSATSAVSSAALRKVPLLSPEWADKAAVELNEKPETVQTNISSLRSMVLAETHLHVRTDDAFLLRFLRARKFNCAEAFRMLQRYYIMKLRCPELFKTPRPSEKQHILEMQAQNMLEDRDSNGRRVYIFRVEKCDAANVSIEDIFRTNLLALEHIVQEPETQIAGLAVIVDMNGFGFQHAKFLSPYYARRTVDVIQETFPLRFKGFHVINQPFYFDAVFAVLKPFLKEKIRRRIYLHGRDLISLHAFISPEILPAEYGGRKPSFDNKGWRLSLLANEDKFVELETYGYKVEDLSE
ncbi:clavesin-2-like isoform X1 [Zootermopsis nevadensis]|uniref:clavesin-2-like isoform X1 n=2 Tax=Zootermopsis nevadensis TaxID=136037 RepID=UPI000B8E4922|nr:clavesin-2-like isoform X1 [Zootermopsis nevadensis]XP_021942926.1 clavesin-2-like isoform X1 [Zootermopsis nevadensis]